MRIWDGKVGILAFCAVAMSLLSGCLSSVLGEARLRSPSLATGEPRVEPREASPPTGGESGVIGALLDSWAQRPLPDWSTQGKVNAPRVILAKLAAGCEVAAANSYLMAARPCSTRTAAWAFAAMRRSGDSSSGPARRGWMRTRTRRS